MFPLRHADLLLRLLSLSSFVVACSEPPAGVVIPSSNVEDAGADDDGETGDDDGDGEPGDDDSDTNDADDDGEADDDTSNDDDSAEGDPSSTPEPDGVGPEPEATSNDPSEPADDPVLQDGGIANPGPTDPTEPGPAPNTPAVDPIGDAGPTPQEPEPTPQEPGPTEPSNVLRVPVIYRDFSGDHPDFGILPGYCQNEYASLGLVAERLDADDRPTLSADAPELGCISSPTSFGEWYRDGVWATTVMGELVLYDNGAGGFVNRFGPNGEQFTTVANTGSEVSYGTDPTSCQDTCFLVAEYSTVCTSPATPEDEAECAAMVEECNGGCRPCSFSASSWCVGGVNVYYDGNPLFFPVDDVEGATRDPGEAKLPAQYGFPGWPWEEAALGTAVEHNFYFTTEVRHSFRYDADTNARLDFTGDDDLWVFVNGILAVDLGGTHVPLDGSVTIDQTSATQFELEPGNVYEVAVFHAERMMEGSSFRLTLTGF